MQDLPENHLLKKYCFNNNRKIYKGLEMGKKTT